jgi:DNA-binding NarL/FixJ family response regulator
MNAPQVLSVLLVDDHELIRQGLARAFERTPDFTLAGEAASVDEGINLAHQLQPDVVVTDVRLPDGTGLDLVRELRAENDTMGIVVLTMYAGDDQLFGALEAGASAFVAKDSPSDDVVAAARHASVSPRSFTAADLTGAMRRRLTPTGPQLSARESEVLRLLAEGLGVAAIARQLYVSE